jgi:hypothetical protein
MILPPSCANYLEIWEPQPSTALRASRGLSWDCLTFSHSFNTQQLWYPCKIMFAKEEESTDDITCCLAMHVLSQWATIMSYSDHTISHQEVSFTTHEGTHPKHPKPWFMGLWNDSVCSSYLECPTSQSVLCRSHIMELTWSVPHHKVDSVIPNGIGARILLKPSWRVYL